MGRITSSHDMTNVNLKCKDAIVIGHFNLILFLFPFDKFNASSLLNTEEKDATFLLSN